MNQAVPKNERSNLDRVFFFDTTLRDGEQSPGCSMTIPEKMRMAHALEALGVDIIEAGFAIASPGDAGRYQQHLPRSAWPTHCFPGPYPSVKISRQPPGHWKERTARASTCSLPARTFTWSTSSRSRGRRPWTKSITPFAWRAPTWRMWSSLPKTHPLGPRFSVQHGQRWPSMPARR